MVHYFSMRCQAMFWLTQCYAPPDSRLGVYWASCSPALGSWLWLYSPDESSTPSRRGASQEMAEGHFRMDQFTVVNATCKLSHGKFELHELCMLVH